MKERKKEKRKRCQTFQRWKLKREREREREREIKKMGVLTQWLLYAPHEYMCMWWCENDREGVSRRDYTKGFDRKNRWEKTKKKERKKRKKKGKWKLETFWRTTGSLHLRKITFISIFFSGLRRTSNPVHIFSSFFLFLERFLHTRSYLLSIMLTQFRPFVFSVCQSLCLSVSLAVSVPLYVGLFLSF